MTPFPGMPLFDELDRQARIGEMIELLKAGKKQK
jgi:hypothetical protein